MDEFEHIYIPFVTLIHWQHNEPPCVRVCVCVCVCARM